MKLREAFIVRAFRTPVGKAPRGLLRFTRPDTLASVTIKHLLQSLPDDINKKEIDDIIVGNAMPEAEQGLNVGRLISLMSLDIVEVPGMTVNRYCASGLETIAIASSKIRSGMADCIIAGGTESMSYIPIGGYKPTPDYNTVKNGHEDYYWGMGLTAEKVATKYGVTRDQQDEFALQSHLKATKALDNGFFEEQIVPVEVEQELFDGNKRINKKYIVNQDEGPRRDTSKDLISKLKPVFANNGSVTAGNSSQMSDGAAFVMVVSEDYLNKHNLEPMARLVSYCPAGIEPSIMGIGPVKAVPKALKMAGINQAQIDLIELNEAFASQSVAVINELKLDASTVNVNGGAIALGHPLGCTGTKLTVQLIHELKRQKKKYGMVTMCVGTGQGAAGIFEYLN